MLLKTVRMRFPSNPSTTAAWCGDRRLGNVSVARAITAAVAGATR
jgi:hypothetical protein